MKFSVLDLFCSTVGMDEQKTELYVNTGRRQVEMLTEIERTSKDEQQNKFCDISIANDGTTIKRRLTMRWPHYD
jgi:hypothetical protein